MLIPEDGHLPVITRTGLAVFNNVMIIKVPEKCRKRGETVYQCATLDHSKQTERWPADKFLDSDYSESNSEIQTSDANKLITNEVKESKNCDKKSYLRHSKIPLEEDPLNLLSNTSDSASNVITNDNNQPSTSQGIESLPNSHQNDSLRDHFQSYIPSDPMRNPIPQRTQEMWKDMPETHAQINPWMHLPPIKPLMANGDLPRIIHDVPPMNIYSHARNDPLWDHNRYIQNGVPRDCDNHLRNGHSRNYLQNYAPREPTREYSDGLLPYPQPMFDFYPANLVHPSHVPRHLGPPNGIRPIYNSGQNNVSNYESFKNIRGNSFRTRNEFLNNRNFNRPNKRIKTNHFNKNRNKYLGNGLHGKDFDNKNVQKNHSANETDKNMKSPEPKLSSSETCQNPEGTNEKDTPLRRSNTQWRRNNYRHRFHDRGRRNNFGNRPA